MTNIESEPSWLSPSSFRSFHLNCELRVFLYQRERERGKERQRRERKRESEKREERRRKWEVWRQEMKIEGNRKRKYSPFDSIHFWILLFLSLSFSPWFPVGKYWIYKIGNFGLKIFIPHLDTLDTLPRIWSLRYICGSQSIMLTLTPNILLLMNRRKKAVDKHFLTESILLFVFIFSLSSFHFLPSLSLSSSLSK